MIQNLIRSTSSSREEENGEQGVGAAYYEGNEQVQKECLFNEDENQKENAEINDGTTEVAKQDELFQMKSFLDDFHWLFEHKFDKKGKVLSCF